MTTPDAGSPDPLKRSSPLTRFRLAPNPGPMSLEGTNSYVIGAGTVVDPGPDDEAHLQLLASVGDVRLILITHRHPDHTAGSERLRELTGAPVRALAAEHCHGGRPLVDGEVIDADGVEVRVLATPGHTSDSVSFHLPDDGINGSVLTGDTILGRGTTIIDYPDGRLGAYLESLELLRALGPATVLPAHGPILPDLSAVAEAYLEHRSQRLTQVRAALQELGPEATVEQVADHVYGDVDPLVRGAAEASVGAQLDYLRSE
ncbi:MBL fold metallo-hydrolase [Arthrobacter roseus]|uniref:MBL fold metallo-hydrolase n=1 Tax=Arthrobacter roseus TaxID=136274 RepID=UPI001964B558|nr:MBL fold metallo-hydrolase [Arthrobacter roseus]MBM7846922.1 glyoxylase-like metal-dependent hydrolase (beta-lactamase superfamily II) [Arthrobacter roseus]